MAMRRSTPHVPNASGLSEPHRQLIRVLAQAAVDNYLHEVEVAETAQHPDPGETVAAQQGEAQR